MGREIHDAAANAMHSSIALLQERFRQLQRVKEMREERELLKMLSADHPKHFNSNSNPTMSYYHEPTSLFFHPELMTTIPSRSPLPSPHNVSLSLWPTSSRSQEDDNNNISIFGTPVSMNSLRPTDSRHSTRKQLSLQASWKNMCDNWDSGSDSDSCGVDTTLHL